MNDIAAIKARREAVTPGVWRAEPGQPWSVVTGKMGKIIARMSPINEKAQANAAFIAAAPGDITALLAMVDAANADLAYLRSYVHALERYVPEAARRVAAGEARA